MCRKTGSFRARDLEGYLSYLENRIKYLSTIPDTDNFSEIEYCKEMLEASEKWGNSHRIYYQYIRGNITSKEAMSFLGVPERTFYRIMATHKDKLVGLLNRLEAELMAKYGLDRQY